MESDQPTGGHYIEDGQKHQSPDQCEDPPQVYRSPHSQQISMKEYMQQTTEHTRWALQELTASPAFKMYTQQCHRYGCPVLPVVGEGLICNFLFLCVAVGLAGMMAFGMVHVGSVGEGQWLLHVPSAEENVELCGQEIPTWYAIWWSGYLTLTYPCGGLGTWSIGYFRNEEFCVWTVRDLSITSSVFETPGTFAHLFI